MTRNITERLALSVRKARRLNILPSRSYCAETPSDPIEAARLATPRTTLPGGFAQVQPPDTPPDAAHAR